MEREIDTINNEDISYTLFNNNNLKKGRNMEEMKKCEEMCKTSCDKCKENCLKECGKCHTEGKTECKELCKGCCDSCKEGCMSACKVA